MTASDFTIAQGDEAPILTQELFYENNEGVNLTSATLQFTMRDPTMNAPVKLSGHANIAAPGPPAEVTYRFSAKDTARPGYYVGSWLVTFPGGTPMRFPTDGYISIRIEPSVAGLATTIVGLAECKDDLNIPSNDRTHDAKLIGFLEAASELIENLTGPLRPQVFDEWYEGGHAVISLRHPPNVGFGTTPVLNLLGVSEYRGPIEYNLAIVPSPSAGTIYSVMSDVRMGTITRRTAGGASMPFWSDPLHGKEQVHVVYESGQERPPPNVRLATLETVRWWHETTQMVGKGSFTQADQEVVRPMAAIPYHAEAMLAPTRRHPSIA